MEAMQTNDRPRVPWNKGKLVGQKAPFKPKDVWAMRARMQQEHRTCDLALLNLGIDSNRLDQPHGDSQRACGERELEQAGHRLREL